MCFLTLQNLIVDVFHKHCSRKFFKLCIYINLLGIYQFIPGLMTLTLFLMTLTFFQGHRCVRILNCKLFFRFLSHVPETWYGSYTKKIKCNMLCVTGVYLRNLTNIIKKKNLCLNVSHLSACSSCYCFFECWVLSNIISCSALLSSEMFDWR